MPRIGLRLDTSVPLKPGELMDLARRAEERGYESVWIPEGNGRDCTTQLAAIGAVTSRINLGTGILPVFTRTPTLLAMTAGGVDAISQGRFILGLGTGHKNSVEETQGTAFERPVTRLKETIQAIRGLLRGETVDLDGRTFSLKGSSLGFKPYRADMPIYIAALGPKMMELAGEVADGALITWANPDYLRVAREHIAIGAKRAGRNPDDIELAGYVRVAVEEDLDLLRPTLQVEIARYCSRPFYQAYFRQAGFEEESDAITEAWNWGDPEAAAAAVTDKMARNLSVFGTPEQCRAEVERRRAMGIDQPIVGPYVYKRDDPMSCFRGVVEAFSG